MFDQLGFGEGHNLAAIIANNDRVEQFRVDTNELLDIARSKSKYQVSAASIERLAPHAFNTTPMPFQRTGVCELFDNNTWQLTWDMGTGKTLVICCRMCVGFREQEFRGPLVVICPLNVVQVWVDQLAEHIGVAAFAMVGDPKKRAAVRLKALKTSKTPVLITNFESCLKDYKAIAAIGPDLVVVDEAHRICNASTQTHKACCFIGAKARFRYTLTGTPMPNGPLNIFGIATFLRGDRVFGTTNKKMFEHRHAIYGHEVAPFIRAVIGYTGLDRIATGIASFSSRVKKEEALDLPPVTITEIKCELSAQQKKIYKAIKKDAVSELSSRKGSGELTLQHVIAQRTRLLQISGGFVPDDDGTMHPIEPNGKLDRLIDWLEDAMLDRSSLIVWTAFVEEAKEIHRIAQDRFKVGHKNTWYHCPILYHGAMSVDEKQAALKLFHDTPVALLVATAASTREGLTLVEAYRAAFYSRGDNLLNWLQTKDRIHRIGQTMPVSIYKFIAAGTVDVSVDRNLTKKAELQELLSGGASFDDMLGPDPF